MNTGCNSDAHVSAEQNTQIPGPTIYTKNPDSQHTHRPTHRPTPIPPQYKPTSHTHPVPTGLVKPKPNRLIHSPPYLLPRPSNTFRFHTLHFSHAPHSSLSRHTAHEPRVRPIYSHPALTGTTPHRNTHQHCRHPSTLVLSQDIHYLRPSIHTTLNFNLSRYTLATLNTSQLQASIDLLEAAHAHTTKQLTRTYNTAYTTLQTYHTQSSPEIRTHTPLSGTLTLMTKEYN